MSFVPWFKVEVLNYSTASKTLIWLSNRPPTY